MWGPIDGVCGALAGWARRRNARGALANSTPRRRRRASSSATRRRWRNSTAGRRAKASCCIPASSNCASAMPSGRPGRGSPSPASPTCSAAIAVLPSLQRQRRRDGWRQGRIVGLATLALASVIVVYLFGVPLLADRLAQLVPPAWEQRIGDAAARPDRSLAERRGGLRGLRGRSRRARQSRHCGLCRAGLRRPRFAVQAGGPRGALQHRQRLRAAGRPGLLFLGAAAGEPDARRIRRGARRTSSAMSITGTACRASSPARPRDCWSASCSAT